MLREARIEATTNNPLTIYAVILGYAMVLPVADPQQPRCTAGALHDRYCRNGAGASVVEGSNSSHSIRECCLGSTSIVLYTASLVGTQTPGLGPYTTQLQVLVVRWVARLAVARGGANVDNGDDSVEMESVAIHSTGQTAVSKLAARLDPAIIEPVDTSNTNNTYKQ